MAKRKGQILDFAVAAAAAGSAAFALLAMPLELFTELVWRTRIDVLVPAATPPLGDTARIGAATGTALVLFALVLLLMRALDRPRKRLSVAEKRVTPPRIRRADAHPDAPARAPLFAGDLGEPLDAMPIEEPFDLGEAEKLEDEVSPLPSFLVDEPEQEERREETPEQDPRTPRALDGSISSLAAQLPVTEQDNDASIGQLMQRFEAGVASLGAQEQAMPAPDPFFDAEPVESIAGEAWPERAETPAAPEEIEPEEIAAEEAAELEEIEDLPEEIEADEAAEADEIEDLPEEDFAELSARPVRVKVPFQLPPAEEDLAPEAGAAPEEIDALPEEQPVVQAYQAEQPEEDFLAEEDFVEEDFAEEAQAEEELPEEEDAVERHAPSLAEPRPVSEMPFKSQAIAQPAPPEPEAEDIETRLRSAIRDLRRTARGG